MQLTRLEAREIAVKVGCDPRTVQKAARGELTNVALVRAIEQAARKLGFKVGAVARGAAGSRETAATQQGQVGNAADDDG